jgi:DNA adenine methylase
VRTGVMVQTSMEISPFLKWAGGKRWLLPHLDDLLPKKHNRFIEPFLGSAAAFFFIRPKQAILSDTNIDLIECYGAIRDQWRKVEILLAEHQAKHDQEYYYWMRDALFRDRAKRAAQFIYLNRTCWNGLYRVNLNGKFNVPKGTKDAVVLRSDNFKRIAQMLRRVTVVCSDFEPIIEQASKDDFVFVDPPYTVKHNLNGFIKYNEKLFSWADQIRLHECIVRAVNRGARVIVTNADHRSVRKLYSDFPKQVSISRTSVLAASACHRTQTAELMIQCW